ncbi:response regulator receiver protein [Methylobacterium sp. Leaf456]|uniref:response regulator n=1 Tax=Methylobacterium sp. Leaf456 TaxID=1736382 RepID=UPI0006FA69F8|nr:response regulator [Methylobacterium sp. Leaf456]KQT45438.1 response regulator receiver protein [Methylobacterium sp. Leaf456]
MKLDQIGQALASCYDSLVAEGLPDELAALVRRVDRAEREARAKGQDKQPAPGSRIALVVEDEDETRELAESVLDETDLHVVSCASAEQALSYLQEHGGEVALVFADIRLAGDMDGVQLARAIATLWPCTRLVVTSGVDPEPGEALPEGAVFIPKPWRAFDVLAEAERASRDRVPPVA